MKALAISLAAAMLAAPTNTLYHGPIFAGMPPARLQGDGIGLVAFVSDVRKFCGDPGPGYVIYGCTREIAKQQVIFLPNPCPSGDFEFYARIACHEAAHRAGWGANHEVE